MSVDFAATVARRIRELREARGLSLRQLSHRSGLAPESVSRSERGITEVTLTNLAKIADGLGVELPEFFAFEADVNFSVVRHNEDIARAIAVLESVSTEERLRLVAALEILGGAKPIPTATVVRSRKPPKARKKVG